VLDVTVRKGGIESSVAFTFFAKGQMKDVFKGDDGNGNAWVLKICDNRWDAITPELELQDAMADDVPPSDLCAYMKPTHSAHKK